MKQEAYRKDVDRAFGVLQSRFKIVKGSARISDKMELHDIMTACIILHNRIIEDERDLHANIRYFTPAPTPKGEMIVDENEPFQDFLVTHKKIKNKETHIVLYNALIDHVCTFNLMLFFY
ncbi:hypothetical protein ACOSP7_003144 [Xanthoceras sorbifolium]